MIDHEPGKIAEVGLRTHLARIVFAAFLLTFLAARILVFLIMSRRVPDLYVYVGGTHVHHLNYGIFLLSGVGAYLLLWSPRDRGIRVSAAFYGIGMALTFDEFGMWLHLGGAYWQRSSLDAIVVLAGIFGLLAFAPSIKRFRPRHWTYAAVLAVALLVFSFLLVESFRYADRILAPKVQRIESQAPK